MKTITGTVVSVKMNKTIVIEREITQAHPLYKKVMRKKRRLKAHTDTPVVLGEQVTVKSIAPKAKDVHYQVIGKAVKV